MEIDVKVLIVLFRMNNRHDWCVTTGVMRIR